MERKEQDRLWAELSEESKEQMRTKYAVFSEKNSPESDGYCRGMANVFGVHNLVAKPMTYEEVQGCLSKSHGNSFIALAFDVISERQGEKLRAIGRLLNVAKYLNGDWKPDWENEEEAKWGIYYDAEEKKIRYINEGYCSHAPAYFRTKSFACFAVQILGEDTIITALTTDY